MPNINLPHNHNNNIETVLKHLPDFESIQEAASIFGQLSDSSRLRILWLLCHCEECGTNIAAAVSMSNAAVSHHLKSLKLHGLVNSRRDGKEIYYTLANSDTARLVHQIIDEYFQLSCPTKGLSDHE